MFAGSINQRLGGEWRLQGAMVWAVLSVWMDECDDNHRQLLPRYLWPQRQQWQGNQEEQEDPHAYQRTQGH